MSFGEAKVRHLHLPLHVDEDVAGLDIAVDDVAGVGIAQRVTLRVAGVLVIDLRWQDFDGHGPLQGLLRAFIQRPHATTANERLDVILREELREPFWAGRLPFEATACSGLVSRGCEAGGKRPHGLRCELGGVGIGQGLSHCKSRVSL